jgi:putative Holliday junction resolvase
VTRILALDVGEKTVGMATCDPLGITTTPRETLRRDGSELDRITEMVRVEEIDEIVVGLPISLDGTLGPAARKMLEFVEQLRARVTIPVETCDERLTTVEAESLLIQADTRRAKRRQVIDQVAACLILQDYLNQRQRQSPPPED